MSKHSHFPQFVGARIVGVALYVGMAFIFAR